MEQRHILVRNIFSFFQNKSMSRVCRCLHLHLSDAFIQSDLQVYIFSMCVPWELNPQPFALLMQCSTTEPQGHRLVHSLEAINISFAIDIYIYSDYLHCLNSLNSDRCYLH